jgi:AAA15 family ATPase/GTPase
MSANNYGKSNLLRAIKVGAELPSRAGDDQREYIEYAFDASRNTTNRQTNFHFEIEFKIVVEGKPETIKYGYELEWYGRIVSEWMEVLNTETNRWNGFLERNLDESKYKSSDTGGVNSSLDVHQAELAITSLRYRRDWKYIAYADAICGIKIPIDERINTTLWYAPINKRVPKTSKDKSELFDTDDTSSILYWLNKENKKEFKQVSSAFTALFPQYGEIVMSEFLPREAKNTSSNDGNVLYRIQFIDKHLHYPASTRDLSNGTKRALNAIVWATLAGMSKISLIELEEIETSIHPSLIGRLFDIVTQLAGSCNFMFTTHSPSVAQFLESGSMYIGEPRNDGLARFTRLTSNGVKQINNMANNNGVSPGEMIFQLLSGNDEAISLLSNCLKTTS